MNDPRVFPYLFSLLELWTAHPPPPAPKMSLRRRSEPAAPALHVIPGFRDHLSRSDLFSVCSGRMQERLLQQFHFRHFHAGELLIESGSRANTLFVLLKGHVQVISDKYEAVLAELGPGMFFGEIGALFGVRRTASVVSKTAGLLAVINRAALKEALGEDRVLWNHVKGIAASRYRAVTVLGRATAAPLDHEMKLKVLTRVDSFNSLPPSTLHELAGLAEVRVCSQDEIVDFFSPQTRHVLYVVADGTVKLYNMDNTMRTCAVGDMFVSYDVELDFAKSLADVTTLLVLDAEQTAAVFAAVEDARVQEQGARILRTTHLTDHVDANSSLTTRLAHEMPQISAIVNPAQFSRQRRNSTPIFTDQGQVNCADFVGTRETLPAQVTRVAESIADDASLKRLLLNAGIPAPDSMTLYHAGRLNLAPVAAEMTDGLLLLLVSLLGERVTTLNLTGCHRLTSSGVLGVWLHCPRLAKISLQGCWNLDDRALSTVNRIETVNIETAELREIDVSHCWRLTSKALTLLGPLPLVSLDLSYCKGLDDRTWPAISQFAPTLRRLHLRRCLGVTDASIEGVFGISFPQLEVLDLSECPLLTDASIATLLSLAPGLRQLQLAFDTGVTGAFLIHCRRLPHLRLLDLSHMSATVNVEFCNRLVEACSELEELRLDGCMRLDDDTVSLLMARLDKLKRLSLHGCTQLSQDTLDIASLRYS